MSLLKDVQLALRTMWKSPRITITVLATLVLGTAPTLQSSACNATDRAAAVSRSKPTGREAPTFGTGRRGCRLLCS